MVKVWLGSGRITTWLSVGEGYVWVKICALLRLEDLGLCGVGCRTIMVTVTQIFCHMTSSFAPVPII